MDFKRLSGIVLALGVVGVLASVFWWYRFYGDLVAASRGTSKLGDAFPCLYSDAGGCGFVSGLSQLAGGTPYEPTVFWVSAGVLILGIVLRLSVKK